jgi:alanine dehydrogenase
MKIAIPRERKTLEGRVALTPEAVFTLIEAGMMFMLKVKQGN